VRLTEEIRARARELELEIPYERTLKGMVEGTPLEKFAQRTMYFDVDGRPLSMSEWGLMLQERSEENADEWRIGHDVIGAYEVSTVWLGLDHSYLPEAPPLIFETMVFEPEYERLSSERFDYQLRYSTKDEARAGHERVVAEIRAQVEPAGNPQRP
jgi:hypothetical protein